MNLDDKIKQALQMDAKEVEVVLSKEKGLYTQMFGIFSGGMRNWNIFGMVLATVSGILMFWSGYHFFISENLDDRLFWGVIVLALWTGIMGQKVWFWLQMNRYSTSREIKRLELVVAQMSAKINQQ
jgi:magnesium-transporting ATPase (P-type)